MASSSSAASAPSGVLIPRPKGGVPKNHTWDGVCGAYINTETGAVHVPKTRSADSAAQQKERKRDRKDRTQASGAQHRKDAQTQAKRRPRRTMPTAVAKWSAGTAKQHVKRRLHGLVRAAAQCAIARSRGYWASALCWPSSACALHKASTRGAAARCLREQSCAAPCHPPRLAATHSRAAARAV